MKADKMWRILEGILERPETKILLDKVLVTTDLGLRRKWLELMELCKTNWQLS